MTPTARARGEEKPLIELAAVHKSLGSKHVLCGIDLEVYRDEVTCIIGPSGGGKTTLLRTMNLLTLIDSGEIRFDGNTIIRASGRDIEPWSAQRIWRLLAYGDRSRRAFSRELLVEPHVYRRLVGMVFQEFNLWPNRTVLENLVEGPIHAKGESPQRARERAADVLAQVGLAQMRDRYPSQLSGGQRQRVAIARALMMDAQVLLLDEITSALDPELVGEVLAVLRDLAGRGVAMVVVTHHMEFVREIADRVIVLADGKIIEQGSAAQVMDHPRADRTAKFLNSLAAAR